MVIVNTIVGISVGLLFGWFCTRSPLWLAKFIARNVVGDTETSLFYPPTREFFVYIRQHPESWHLRYPRVYWVIRLTGWLALAMVAITLLMIVLGSLGVAKVYE